MLNTDQGSLQNSPEKNRRSRVSIQVPLHARKNIDEDEGSDHAPAQKYSKSSILSTTTQQIYTMDDDTLVKTVEEMQKTTRYLNLENQILTNFFQKNDPTVLEGMGHVIKTAQAAHDRGSITSRRVTLSRASRRESTLLPITSPSSIVFSLEGKSEKETRTAPRVNIHQRMDLVLKEMEEIQNNLNTALRRGQVVKTRLKCDLEEMTIREGELRQTIDLFESVFITGTVTDKFTQKNPTERFIRFMEDWHRTAGLTVDKIRLRTSSLKVQYQKICGILAHKKLIGENLQEVDFEQLHIENKHLQIKIDSRNVLLLELKKMNGKANLLLSNHKKLLAKKINEMNGLQEAIAEKEDKTQKLDDECTKVARELDLAKEEYDKIDERIRTYRVPDIIDYVRKKAELGTLKKNLRVWARRKQIKEMALSACLREVKHMGGVGDMLSCFNPDLDLVQQTTSDVSFHFKFESKKRKSWHLKAMPKITNHE